MATGSVEEIEEERRLFYVACTRARDDLYVTWPLRYYKRGGAMTDLHGYAQRTRFVTPGVAACLRERQARPDAVGDDAARPEGARASATAASIRAQMREMWS